ncbi:CRISPR-associated endonuclease Cas2 [Fusobacterium polymorphum]|uniref:CRISPR-associated endonuclease Cas2 n=1 Tax=Fusobacterium nucleatum subsp. polymorphum TaxID=76857 RepID=UPI000BFE4C8E|nr:CRISPR-associated endonuclease Cas2 [Fusobacterium polymorphum]PHI12006.1 CRISPR-associated endonuclease Cas2 [Fusobacterium polymorphum]
MNYLLSYDISNDKSRKRVSDYLLEKGFLRIQNSVFLGEIHITKIDDILENICLLVDKKEDSIFCIPINKENYKNIFNFGKNEDYNLYKDEVLYI